MLLCLTFYSKLKLPKYMLKPESDLKYGCRQCIKPICQQRLWNGWLSLGMHEQLDVGVSLQTEHSEQAKALTLTKF